MDLTLPGLSDVWKASEEFRPLKFPGPCFVGVFFPPPSATTGGSDPNTRLHGTITNKHINTDETTQKVTMLVWNKRTHSTPTPGKSNAFSDAVRCF